MAADPPQSRHGMHNRDQTAFRIPADLKAWLESHAIATGRTMTDIVITALESERTGPPVVTEHGLEMSGGGVHVRWDGRETERLYPLADWIPAQQRNGGIVLRRRVVVLEPWNEVPATPAS